MLSQTQQKRTEKTFEMLDANSDGQIDRSDFQAKAEQVLQAFNESPSSPKGKAVVNAYLEEWEGLARHSGNGSSGLDISAFKRAADTYMTADGGKGYYESVRPTIQAITELADTDGNGVLDLDEFRTLFNAIGIGGKDAESAFRALDTNGDNSLSVDEVVAGWRAYYFDEQEAGKQPSLLGGGI